MRRKKTTQTEAVMEKASARTKGWLSEIKQNWQLYLMLLIPFTYVVVFKYFPMVGAQIAFRQYVPVDGIWNSQWVGLKHFVRFFSNPQWQAIIKNTLAISIYSLILSIPFPIILAIAFDYTRSNLYRKTVQMITFLPHFLSTVIIVSLMNLIFDNRVGIVNNLIEVLFGAKVNILGEAKYFRSLYVWSGIWQATGWNSILYISALAGVDTQIHEAAIIDGANKLRRIWHIDLTSIRPTIAVMTIMNLGSILSVGFDKTYMMQNPINLHYSEVLSTYEYKMGTGGIIPNYSYGAAIGLMVSVINFILIVLSNKLSNKLSGSGLW